MALIDRIRKQVRVTAKMVQDANGIEPGGEGYVLTMGSPFDDELNLLIDAAKADMCRVGIRDELLDADDLGADVEMAITLFVKGNFGYDNAEAPRFLESYRMAVIDLMNSPANSSAGEIVGD